MMLLRKMSTGALSSVASNLKNVQEKIRIAASKRPQNLQYVQPRLVAVTKIKGNEYIFEAYDAGQRHFGENYVLELHEKSNDIELRDRCLDIKWHFIGHLQRNKVSKILDVPNLFVIETVDSDRIAKVLNDSWARLKKDRLLNVMVQCNTSGEESKNGCPPDDVENLVRYVKEECPNIYFMGLMTIGQYDYDMSLGPNPDFQCMIKLREKVCKSLNIPIESMELSMGMSTDYEHAAEVGSTNIRIGTTIFGARDKPKHNPANPDPQTSEAKEKDNKPENNPSANPDQQTSVAKEKDSQVDSSEHLKDMSIS